MMTDFKTYNGELDDVDPVAFGEKLFLDGKALNDDTDPTYYFYARGNEDDFLEAFREKMESAWYQARARANREAYFKALPDFQARIPEVGSSVFIEFPGNPGKYFPCMIEYVPPERDQIVIRFEKKGGEYHGSLRVVGYEYPGQFPTFYNEPPDSAAPQTGDK